MKTACRISTDPRNRKPTKLPNPHQSSVLLDISPIQMFRVERPCSTQALRLDRAKPQATQRRKLLQAQRCRPELRTCAAVLMLRTAAFRQARCPRLRDSRRKTAQRCSKTEPSATHRFRICRLIKEACRVLLLRGYAATSRPLIHRLHSSKISWSLAIETSHTEVTELLGLVRQHKPQHPIVQKMQRQQIREGDC
jgi:hypothetical protein